jgi:hypothetical protein
MPETSPIPESELVELMPFLAEPFEPHILEAEAKIKKAIEQEEIYGPTKRVQATYEEALEEYNQAAYRGKELELELGVDPVTFAANWAVVGSMVEIGPVDNYESETISYRTGTLEVPDSRRRFLANTTRERLSDVSKEVALKCDAGEVPIDVAVEVGIIAAQNIEILENKRLLDSLDPTNANKGKTPAIIMNRVNAVLDDVLSDDPTEQAEGLDRVVDVYRHFPDQHRHLSLCALNAMIEGDPTILIKAAQRIEEEASQYSFARAA